MKLRGLGSRDDDFEVATSVLLRGLRSRDNDVEAATSEMVFQSNLILHLIWVGI